MIQLVHISLHVESTDINVHMFVKYHMYIYLYKSIIDRGVLHDPRV